MKKDIINNRMDLLNAQLEYDSIKKMLEYERLELKYSPQYNVYKTIKEKEERAKIATRELDDSLFEANIKLQKAKLRVELDDLEMYQFAETCDCCCKNEDNECVPDEL